MDLKSHEIQCPYCEERIEVDIESMSEPQAFIEDCTVCCRPIQYHVNPGLEEGDEDEIVVSRSD